VSGIAVYELSATAAFWSDSRSSFFILQVEADYFGGGATVNFCLSVAGASSFDLQVTALGMT